MKGNSRGVGKLTVRDWEEADDILDNWVKPTARSSSRKRVYGPFEVHTQLRLLRELKNKLEKKPQLLTEAREDLARREETNPDRSRFRIRWDVISDQIKKVRMGGKFKKTFVNLYVLFKARLIVDSIFGDDLLTKTIQKSNNDQGLYKEKPEPLVEDTSTIEALEKLKEKHNALFEEHRFGWEFHRDFYGGDRVKFLEEALKFVRKHKKPSPPRRTTPPAPPRNSPPAPPKKKPSRSGPRENTPRNQSLSNSPPKTKTKRKRCPNGTRFNKKTQKCEPKK